LVRCEECGARLWNERPPTEPVVAELEDADGISALVERLRAHCTDAGMVELMDEAADALTRLEAEIREVRDRERRWKSSAEYVGQEIVKAQATIARLDAEVRVCNDVCGERNATIARLEAEWAAFFKQLAEAQATITRHERTIKEINEVWGRDAAELERWNDLAQHNREAYDALQSERDRLREALGRIVAKIDEADPWKSRADMHFIARAALAGEK
jgi:chromosome segregation ATPase